MARFIARRLLQLIPILLGLSFLLFVWVRALPGGPENALLGERGTPAQLQRIRESYGLDEPVIVQYGKYLERMVTFDFGSSISSRQPVTEEIRQRFPATVELALAAMFFAIVVGIPLGFLAARHHGRWFDHTSIGLSLIGVSIPVFFLAFLLKWLFGVKLGWLPTIGRIDATIDIEHPTYFYTVDAIVAGDWSAFVDVLKHLILPAIALGSISLAIIARITRASVLEVTGEDYVRTARAKGMTRSVVERRHILRNALLPITTVIGLQVGLLLSGAVLTETVFAWGGMGTLISDAIFNRDYPVLQGGILFLAVVFVLVNLAVDVLYAVLDPRIRVS